METTRHAATDLIPCPHCRAEIPFYRFGAMGDLCPHFYCDRCSNVFHRGSDFARVRGREPSPELLAEIASDLPECPCGGRFSAGANPKCPFCRQEIAHAADPVQRLHDPYAVIVEGALLVNG